MSSPPSPSMRLAAAATQLRVCVRMRVCVTDSPPLPSPLLPSPQIWIACLPDHSKLRVNLSHLKTGKYILKRRSA